MPYCRCLNHVIPGPHRNPECPLYSADDPRLAAEPIKAPLASGGREDEIRARHERTHRAAVVDALNGCAAHEDRGWLLAELAATREQLMRAETLLVTESEAWGKAVGALDRRAQAAEARVRELEAQLAQPKA